MVAVVPAKPAAPRALPMPVRVIRGVLVALVLLAALIAVILAVSVRHASDGVDTIFGHPVFSVASGSMTPAIDTGDLIVDQPVALPQATSLHVGQVISFVTSTSGANSMIVTHRIVDVLPGPNSSGVQYRTKGDANNAPDPALVAPGQVLGLYSARIPVAGYMMSTLHQPLTFVILIMIPVVYLVGGEVRRRWIRLGEEDRLAREERVAAQADDDVKDARLIRAPLTWGPSRTEWGKGGGPSAN